MTDALVNVFIVAALCLLCFSVFRSVAANEEIYDDYITRTNERYDWLYADMEVCAPCVTDSGDR